MSMKCVACKQNEASTKKLVRVDTATQDVRQPLPIIRVDVCDDCYKKIEGGELAIDVIPNPNKPS